MSLSAVKMTANATAASEDSLLNDNEEGRQCAGALNMCLNAVLNWPLLLVFVNTDGQIYSYVRLVEGGVACSASTIYFFVASHTQRQL